MIPIYKNEIKDGLANKILTDTNITLLAELQLQEAPKEVFDIDSIKAKAEEIKDFDLYYLLSILASVGWNGNDDVFGKEETWMARSTAVHKPFNYMHNAKDIIGNIVSAKVQDFDGNEIDINSALEDVPDQFDIVVGSVIYKFWPEKEDQERIDKLIAEIEEKKWAVSMECLFRNFDYAIETPEGEQYVVARNEQTSFLTKHLRRYQGSGEFEGNKIGRFLRNFTFSGKGLVNNPANKRSQILAKSELFTPEYKTNFSLIKNTKENFVMSTVANEITYTKAQFDALNTQLEEVKAEMKKVQEKEVTNLKSEIDSLTKANQDLKNDLSSAKEIVNVKEETVKTLEQEKADLQKKLSEAEKSLEEIKLEAVKADRKSKLLEKVDAEKADSLLEKFMSASDEMFAELLNALPKKSEAAGKPPMTDKEKEEKAKKEKEKAKADEIAALENANSNEQPLISEENEDDVLTTATEWISTILKSKSKK